MYAPHNVTSQKIERKTQDIDFFLHIRPTIAIAKTCNNMLPTNIPNLEVLTNQRTVRRPVNAFYRKRDYTERELDTLKRLDSDASKAAGRELSDIECNVLLEYKGRLIATQSRTETVGVATGILTGLAFTFYVPRVRGLWNRQRYVRWTWNLCWRTYVGYYIAGRVTNLQIAHRTDRHPLNTTILGDPRMGAFKESIELRKEEFGGHESFLVRSWRTMDNPEPPIQWFRNRKPIGNSYPSRPLVDHPELRWYRAWPSESDGERPGDDASVSRKQKSINSLERSRHPMEYLRGNLFVWQITDLALKPCMYID